MKTIKGIALRLLGRHVCKPDQWGTCDSQNRDWCNPCGACTIWNGEFCAVCGAEWGVTNA